MAALVGSFGLSVTACSDDDDDNKGNEELKADDPYAKNGDQATSLFRVVGTLAELDSLPDNWQTATFEPTKGKVLDASKPLVRSLAVANLAEAVSMFRTLTGENIAENATSASWNKDGVGSLKFTATNASNETAVIDVNIKQMPKLTQLRLVPASAMGENGSFTGDPYYHIGDVVKDADGRFWICVRSAWSPASKEDTHWVSMQLLSTDSKQTKLKKNIREIKAKAGKNGLHKIQQQLANSEETKHLKYFAQLMYILNYPDQYAENCVKGEIMEDGLGDLGVQAHPIRYVKKLAQYWNSKDIWSKVMPGVIGNSTKTTVTKDYFKKAFTMLYYGHDFSSLGMGNDCTIYTCEQSGKALSVQTLGKKTWTYNSSADNKYDCTDFVLYGKADKNTSAGFTGEAIVVVQASGKTLNGGKNPGATAKIAKCTDVLVGKDQGFNKEDPVNKNDQPEIGDIISAKGDVYATYDEAEQAGDKVPIAMIVYKGKPVTKDVDDSTAKSYLAIALTPAADGANTTLTWGPTDQSCGTAIDQDKEYQKLIASKNGLEMTDKLCSDGHTHPAAKQSKKYLDDLYIETNYEIGGHKNFSPSNFFLPAVGQWVFALKGMGAWDNSSNGAKVIETIKALYDKAGVPAAQRIPMDGTGIWTCIEASKGYSYVLKIDSKNGARFEKAKKDTKLKVFPFILFG